MERSELAELSERLSVATEALAALGAALRLRVSGERAPDDVQSSLDQIVDALGVRAALEAATPEYLAEILAPIRALFLESVDLLTDPSRAPGWAYADADLLESLGRSSAGIAEELRALASTLPGLADSLDRPGAAFLDVGVGVAATSIAMCEIWPCLRVVGIDPYELALSLARRNVERAGLADRVELRRQGVEQLEDEACFDLAWLAGPFLSRSALETGLERVLRALRPGGWAVLGLYADEDPLRAGLARLRTARFGGTILHPDEGEALLRDAGFLDVRAIRAEVSTSAVDVVGRRPASVGR